MRKKLDPTRIAPSPGVYETTDEMANEALEREGLVLGNPDAVSAAHYGRKQKIPVTGTGTKIKNAGGV